MTLRELRKRANLTQDQVARALCICQSAVYYWESGKTGVSGTKRSRLAELYGCTVLELADAIVETRKERSEKLGEREAELSVHP